MLSADPGGLTLGLQLLRVSCKAQRGVANHMQGNAAVAGCGSWVQAYAAAALGVCCVGTPTRSWFDAMPTTMICCQCCLNVMRACQASSCRRYAHSIHCEIAAELDFRKGAIAFWAAAVWCRAGCEKHCKPRAPCRLQGVQLFAVHLWCYTCLHLDAVHSRAAKEKGGRLQSTMQLQLLL
jgi:hypothetical protein